jgi:hypothetical protein
MFRGADQGMLKRLLHNGPFQAVAVYLVGMALFWLISLAFGLTGYVCDYLNQSDYENCPRHNLAFVGLWRIGEFVNWLGPAVTAIATALMVYVTYLLVKLGREQAEAAGRQLAISGQQADIQLKQQQIERLQFLATHRPWLTIRNVEIRRPTDDGPLFEPDQPINGWLVVVNTGAAKATIISTEYRFFASYKGLPMAPPLDADKVKRLIFDVPHEMAPHESYRTDIEHVALGPKIRNILLGGPDHLYVMGAIRYSDEGEAEHWMGFCRRYITGEVVIGEGRFVPEDNSDYEYQD